MVVEEKIEGTRAVIKIKGRLDTRTAPELEERINPLLDKLESLVFDLEELVYISSMGLRVLLSAHKKLSPKGGLSLCNVCEDVMQVFDITGFTDILNIN